MNRNKLIVILGPTAVGKTKLAVKLAFNFGGEIISADSRQVYRRMNIGTGKDYEDYFVNSKRIQCHLIDLVEPSEEFNLFRFVNDFIAAYNKITNDDKLPFLVGGTGLYIDAVLKRYRLSPVDFSKEFDDLSSRPIEELRKILLKLNPAPHNVTDLQIKERLVKAIIVARNKNGKPLEFPAFSQLVIGVNIERGELKEKIRQRLEKRLQDGMIEEVRSLLDEGISYGRLFAFGLEYKFLALYLKGELSFDEMFEKLNRAIYKFAKRQMTWYRKLEREGTDIHWLKPNDFDYAAELINKYLTT